MFLYTLLAAFNIMKGKSNSKHLTWIYNRMSEVHKENPNYDYMIKFKKIITLMEEQEQGLRDYLKFIEVKSGT